MNEPPLNSQSVNFNGAVDFTRKNFDFYFHLSGPKRLFSVILFIAFFASSSAVLSPISAQPTCMTGAWQNGNTDHWSEECYLNNACGLQGNPCHANDVLLDVFIAVSVGGPVLEGTVGEQFIPDIDFEMLTDFALFTAAAAFDILGSTFTSGDSNSNVRTIAFFPP